MPSPPRIPTEEDFAPVRATVPLTLHFPSPPESTVAILLLHGLGDSHTPFAHFARSLNLPGVLAIAVRGPSPLPLLPGFHWGDDVTIDQAAGGVETDPGFRAARRIVLRDLVGEVLLRRCGWDLRDILVFGFGQGGSLALGLASRLRCEEDLARDGVHAFKGVVSIGGALPASMNPTHAQREKSETSILLCQLDEDEDDVKAEFRHVQVVRWKRPEIAMPRNAEEAFPIKYFADRLKHSW